MQMILEPSKYLQAIRKDKDAYIIYHSLFGGPVRINKKTLDFIRSFNGGVTVRDIVNKKNRLSEYKDIIDCLKNRHFLTEKKFDEYALFQAAHGSKFEEARKGRYINNLRLEMASYCNFKCSHCFAQKIYTLKKGLKMRFDTARLAVDGFINILKNNHTKHGNIVFWGGEPLLNWDVIKKTIEHIRTKTNNSPINIDLSIITNGSLLNDSVLNFMKLHDLKPKVSLDGLEEDNDRFRQFVNGRGTFKSIVNGLDGLLRHGINFSIQLTLNNYNFYSVEKVIDFLCNRYNKVCEHIQVKPVFYQKASSRFDNHSNGEKAKRLVAIYEYGDKKGINIGIDGLTIVESAVNQDYHLFHCCGLYSSFYIKPSGDVCTCEELGINIGNVRGMERVTYGKNYKYIATRRVDKIISCRGCKIEGFCAGGCAGMVRFYSDNIYDTSHSSCRAFYCDYLLKFFEEMLKYLF